jgi:hypothetical protein
VQEHHDASVPQVTATGLAVTAVLQGAIMRTRTVLLVSVLGWGCSAAVAEGLALREGAKAWPQWQARLSISTTSVQRYALTDPGETQGAPRNALQGGAVLGDYYFRSLKFGWLAPEGGFRATSGLMRGTRSLAVADPPALLRSAPRLTVALQSVPPSGSAAAETVPYLGIGYTGLSVKGGWGFTADLGLTAENPAGAVRFGRALFGSQGFDSALRELRLSPLLQFGVSYSF